MRKIQIKTFYNEKQVLVSEGNRANFSKSPLKPKLLLEYLKFHGLIHNFEIFGDFKPFEKADFELAHDKGYVDEFFKGEGRCSTNNLGWSEQFAESVTWTNASLYNAIRNSIVNPDQISFSPTSGFHHASPNHGSGFCTFSGQVIASLKIWQEFGISGAYLDLDGHFGNSIEDSYGFCKDLKHAIPIGFNINPSGRNAEYVRNLKLSLNRLKRALIKGEIGYVVWCHGADSHDGDDLGGTCNTKHWTECSDIFWNWVSEMDLILPNNLPVACALFGGYRSDDYNSVLSLHTYDLVSALRNNYGLQIDYTPEVKESRKNNTWLYTERNKTQKRLQY